MPVTATRFDCAHRGQRVDQPDGAEVDPVIVGLVRHVDAGRGERVECRWRCAKRIHLRLRRPALGDGGFEVHHRNVSAAQDRCDRREHRCGIGCELSPQDALEVHIAGERKRDRPVRRLRGSGRGRRCSRRRRGRHRRRHCHRCTLLGGRARACSRDKGKRDGKPEGPVVRHGRRAYRCALWPSSTT